MYASVKRGKVSSGTYIPTRGHAQLAGWLDDLKNVSKGVKVKFDPMKGVSGLQVKVDPKRIGAEAAKVIANRPPSSGPPGATEVFATNMAEGFAMERVKLYGEQAMNFVQENQTPLLLGAAGLVAVLIVPKLLKR